MTRVRWTKCCHEGSCSRNVSRRGRMVARTWSVPGRRATERAGHRIPPSAAVFSACLTSRGEGSTGRRWASTTTCGAPSRPGGAGQGDGVVRGGCLLVGFGGREGLGQGPVEGLGVGGRGASRVFSVLPSPPVERGVATEAPVGLSPEACPGEHARGWLHWPVNSSVGTPQERKRVGLAESAPKRHWSNSLTRTPSLPRRAWNGGRSNMETTPGTGRGFSRRTGTRWSTARANTSADLTAK